MITGRLIKLIVSFFLTFSFLFTECAREPVSTQAGSLNNKEVKNLSADDLNVAILYFVNVYRKSKGRVPIQRNSYESAVALQHSVNMANGTVPFGHDGFASRVKSIEKQLGAIQETGENVAFGRMTAREVVDAWLHSPVHRKNIEGNFQLTGVGCAKNNKGVIYYTEIFTR